MRPAIPIFATLFAVIAIPHFVQAAEPATRPEIKATTQADPAVVGDLVSQLDHQDFKVREAATRKLIEMGEPVRPALEAKLKEPDLDPEVALRINTVLKDTGLWA